MRRDELALQCHPELTDVILSVSEGSHSPSCEILSVSEGWQRDALPLGRILVNPCGSPERIRWSQWIHCASLGSRFPSLGAIDNTLRITWKEGYSETRSIVGLKNSVHNDRYVSGIFDNKEKTLDNKAKWAVSHTHLTGPLKLQDDVCYKDDV